MSTDEMTLVEILRFRKLFGTKKCSVIGMVHVGALPGTPNFNGPTKKIISAAIREAKIYRDCNIDGVLVENMHDVPYVRPQNLTPDVVAMMTRVCVEIRKVLPENIPCGVQILAGCNEEAIAVAKAADFQFVRVEGFVFSHIADEGFTDACAGSLLRYRKRIDADDILVFADVKKKHSSHALTSDVNLSATVKAAKFFLADGIVLTGTATGEPTNLNELKEARKATDGPVLIGSGVTKDNIEDYYSSSNAVIIGSHFKVSGMWQNEVDSKRVRTFMEKIEELRKCE